MAKRNENEIEVSTAWKRSTILGGALVGAFAGVIAAYMLTRRAEREERETPLTASEGLKLGLLVFGLLRTIASLGDDD
jgi:Co/Zn/Cd efflux system component